MYQLQVIMPGDDAPIETVFLPRGDRVLEMVSLLLRQFAGCASIEVFAGSARLFRVEGGSAEAQEAIEAYRDVDRLH